MDSVFYHCMPSIPIPNRSIQPGQPDSRIQKLEQENSQLREMLLEMKDRLDRLEKKGDTLKSEDKSPKEEKKKSGKKKEDTPKANASVAAAADLPSETEETKEKTIDTTKQDLEDIRVTDKKKKAENWLPSYFWRKIPAWRRVKIDYFDGGDESQLPSAIPEHPGGSFSSRRSPAISGWRIKQRYLCARYL